MPNTTANGIRIEYVTYGNRHDPALLLVMGLGAQMTRWDDAFCELLAAHGLWVVKFDNRDVGLSTHFTEAPVPSMGALVAAMAEGAAPDVPYTLHDMAADGFGLLDALGVERAHICGASLGGMIVQTMAIDQPNRVLSMTSIMSSTQDPSLPAAHPAAAAVLQQPPATSRGQAIERAVEASRIIGSPRYPADPDRIRERAALDYDRAFDPAGVARQMAAAVVATGTRRERLRSLTVPTLVIHGADDPLVPLACGEDTAAAIPGAELLVIDGMGHDLPPALHQRIADAIARHALPAGGAR
ncbi:MAG TPA: alpha/beta fold hydrolase [Pseudomonadales bacterium]